MPEQLAWSQACENNKGPILEVLRRWLPATGDVLEIGAGTGQHAIFFAQQLPGIRWQPTDRPGTLDTVAARVRLAGLANLAPPEPLDLHRWSREALGPVDAVFSANTAHIVDWAGVQALFAGVAGVLRPGGVFLLYGPFAYGGQHTAPSNARFHQTLRAQDPASGIRDVDDLRRLGEARGLILAEDVAMPANNRTLVWQLGQSRAGDTAARSTRLSR